MPTLDEVDARLKRLENKPKDFWDKLNAGGAAIAVAVIGGILAYFQFGFERDLQDAKLQADRRINEIQQQQAERFRLLDKDLADRDADTREAELLEAYIPHIASTDSYVRRVAQRILFVTKPELGEKILIEVAQTEGDQAAADAARNLIQQTSRVHQSKSVQLVGGWGLVAGDADMDTDGRDIVPIHVRSVLTSSDREVRLEVDFGIREMGGDRTTIQGTRKVVLYSASADQRVLFVESPNGLVAEINAETVGKQHSFVPLQTGGTHWQSLQARVDGPGADLQAVGINGIVNFVVVLGPARLPM